MRNIFILAAFVLGMTILNNNAFAAPCDLVGCSVVINGDAGHTSRRCTAPGGLDHCSCTTAATECENVSWVSSGSSCPAGWMFIDFGNDGRKCCGRDVDGIGCFKKTAAEENSAPEEFVGEENIEEILAESMGEIRADTYFGYVDGVNRSPAAGRGNSTQAKLDACLFYSDVDAINAAGGTLADKLTRCYGATYGCGTVLKNEYCQATGTNDGVGGVSAAVCKDRCDCLYGGSCGGL